MEVTYYAPNHSIVHLPNGAAIKPVDGAFVADIAYRTALETAGIILAEGSEIPTRMDIDLTTDPVIQPPFNGQTAKNSWSRRDIYIVLQGLPAGFAFTVIQGYSVPTGFEAGAGVTLNGAKLMTSQRGEGLRLEYVSTDVYDVVPV